MKFQVTLANTDGKAVAVVETPQELWDAIKSATGPVLGRLISVSVTRVIAPVTKN